MVGSRPPLASAWGPLAVIAGIVCTSAGAFAYTAGWLSPARLTSTRLVEAFGPHVGAALGHRLNHAKGICFTGSFDSNGDGSEISEAAMFASGRHPALGRFNLATTDPDAPDATVRVRGMGLQVTAPEGGTWRSAMIDAPFFPVSTPQAFYELLVTSAKKDATATKAFEAAHPEYVRFEDWAGKAAWTGSYAEEPYNSLDSFVVVDRNGARRTVRWSLLPRATPVPITPAEIAARGADDLEREIADRVGAQPQLWDMVVTIADAGDPADDPSRAWPPGRRTIRVGTLTVDRIEAEADGPCRDITFDPTILPKGIELSDDPFPAARSATYAKSYDLRTAEAKDYPHTERSAKP